MTLLFLRRVVQLPLGLVLYGVGIALMIRAAVGVSPWEVLGQGVALRAGIPFGLAVNIIGALVLLLWIPLRQRPGVGTVLNVVAVGPSAQFALAFIPEQTSLWVQVPLFAAGLLLVAIATGLYIGAGYGPGPRDGLMTGISRRFSWPIWAVRTSIEAFVLGLGWLLGGNVGVGTLAFALLIGPLVGRTLPMLRAPAAPTPPATLPPHAITQEQV